MKYWVRRVLLKNLFFKIISLALAVLLFIVVHAEKHTLLQGILPITYTIPAGQLLLNKPPASIHIGVTGPISRMQHFRLEDLGNLNVDLATIKEGSYYRFHEEAIPLPSGLKIAFIRPDGFTVRYEPTIQRRVPIRLAVSGELPHGFRLINRKVKPNKATVSGPRSVAASLMEVPTQVINLAEVTSNFSRQVSFATLSPGLKVISPTVVEVTMEIEPLRDERTISGIPVRFEDPQKRKSRLLTKAVQIVVTGPARDTARLEAGKLIARLRSSIYLRGSKFKLKPVIEGLPASVKVMRVSPAEVEVQIIY